MTSVGIRETTAKVDRMGVVNESGAQLSEVEQYEDDPQAWREAKREEVAKKYSPIQRPAAVMGKRQSGGVLLTFFLLGVAASVIDISFLQDVLGQLLNMPGILACGLSAAIGLVAMVLIMGSGGYQRYFEDTSVKKSWLKRHYDILLWVFLGLLLFVLRVMAGTFIDLSETEAVSAIHIGSLVIRSSDLIMAPIMFVLYLATGSLAMYCIDHFFETDMFYDIQVKSRNKKIIREVAQVEGQLRRELQRLKQKGVMADRSDKMHEELLKKKMTDAKIAYGKKLSVMQKKRDEIDSKLASMRMIASELKGVPDDQHAMESVVRAARTEIQGQVAMMVSAKSNISAETLMGLVNDYNKKHPF